MSKVPTWIDFTQDFAGAGVVDDASVAVPSSAGRTGTAEPVTGITSAAGGTCAQHGP